MDQVTPSQPANNTESESLPEAVETPQAVSQPVPPSAPEAVPEAIPETRTADTPSEELAPPAPASGGVQAPEAPSAGSPVSETPPVPAPVLEGGSIPVSEPAEVTTPAPVVEPSSEPPPAPAPEPEIMAAPSAPQPPPQERIIERVSPPSEADVHALNAHQLKALAPKAREAKRSKVQNRLDAIVQYLKTKGYIANDEVQKLLRVSDATATRYLRALVKSGIVMKLGKGGRGARYRLVQGNQ